jgi:hypothetical protein
MHTITKSISDSSKDLSNCRSGNFLVLSYLNYSSIRVSHMRDAPYSLITSVSKVPVRIFLFIKFLWKAQSIIFLWSSIRLSTRLFFRYLIIKSGLYICRAYSPCTHARKEEDGLLLEFPCNPTRTRSV